MSSEPQQAKFPLRRVALYGGGRWSRVLLPVTQSLLVEDAEIAWVTDHNREVAQRWLAEKNIERVTLYSTSDFNRKFTAPADDSAPKIQCAIVATSPPQHAALTRALLQHRVPTFCEKPLTLDFEQANALQQLASEYHCPLGVNLEMHFASFIEDFATRLHERPMNAQPIRTLDVAWTDPWTDVRYGEIKIGDVYTNIVDDMWPHCWSLLRRIRPSGSVTAIDGVNYNPVDGQVDITLRFDDIATRLSLGRRANHRLRRVNVNRGEAILDFSSEPGTSEINGQRVDNAWRGSRPLTRSLASFFEVVQRPELINMWPLSASACLDSVRSAQAIASQLQSQQRALLDRFCTSGIDTTNPSHRNLVVDLLLPEYAAKDRRWSVATHAEQVAFVTHVCEAQGLRRNSGK